MHPPSWLKPWLALFEGQGLVTTRLPTELDPENCEKNLCWTHDKKCGKPKAQKVGYGRKMVPAGKTKRSAPVDSHPGPGLQAALAAACNGSCPVRPRCKPWGLCVCLQVMITARKRQNHEYQRTNKVPTTKQKQYCTLALFSG